MPNKITALSLSLLFSLTTFYQSQARAADIDVKSYQWSKDDSTVSLEVPYASNDGLQKGIYSRADVIAKSAFGKTFYLPHGPHDTQFESKMDAFYEASQKASADIPLKAPVLTFDLTTKVVTETADMVSLQLSANAMIKGAAHPSVTGGFINYNPQTNMFYDDLSFLPSSVQAKVMSTVFSKLKEKLGKNLMVTGPKIFPLLANNFSVDGQNLNFTFQPGTVAPVSYGPQSVSVTLPKGDNT